MSSSASAAQGLPSGAARRQPASAPGRRGARPSSSTSRSRAASTSTRSAFARALDDPAFRADGRRAARRPPRAGERVGVPGGARAAPTRTRSGPSCRTGSGGPSSRSRRCRRRCPGMRVVRDPARARCARAGGTRDPQRRGRRARERDGRRASTAMRARAGAARRRARAPTGSCSRPAASPPAALAARLATGGRARRRSACRSRGVPGAARRASCPATSTSSRWRARAWRSTRACARSAPTATACSSNVLVAGATLGRRRAVAREVGRRASAWRRATARPG